MAATITIRPGRTSDESELRRLAQLEGRPTPEGELMVAELDGEIWAALEPVSGCVWADPFRPSASVVQALRSAVALVDEAIQASERGRWRSRLARRGLSTTCPPDRSHGSARIMRKLSR
jgi:hypothetical protein